MGFNIITLNKMKNYVVHLEVHLRVDDDEFETDLEIEERLGLIADPAQNRGLMLKKGRDKCYYPTLVLHNLRNNQTISLDEDSPEPSIIITDQITNIVRKE